MIDIIYGIKDLIVTKLAYDVDVTSTLTADSIQDYTQIVDDALVVIATNVKLQEGSNNNVCNSFARSFDLPIHIIVGRPIDGTLTDAEQQEQVVERMREADNMYRNIAKLLLDDQGTLGQVMLTQNEDDIYHLSELSYQSGAVMSFKIEFNL